MLTCPLSPSPHAHRGFRFLRSAQRGLLFPRPAQRGLPFLSLAQRGSCFMSNPERAPVPEFNQRGLLFSCPAQRGLLFPRLHRERLSSRVQPCRSPVSRAPRTGSRNLVVCGQRTPALKGRRLTNAHPPSRSCLLHRCRLAAPLLALSPPSVQCELHGSAIRHRHRGWSILVSASSF